MLTVGKKAPDFSLRDQDGNEKTLKDYLGKWLLLYFYPKDFTPGCTTEACNLRDNYNKLQKKVNIIGISKDTIESHKKFQGKYTLPFTLLSDLNGTASKEYGTNGVIFAKRASFLISPKGLIENIYPKVNPQTHAEQILKDLN
jgi:peroxiredoxin Q/BCP